MFICCYRLGCSLEHLALKCAVLTVCVCVCVYVHVFLCFFCLVYDLKLCGCASGVCVCVWGWKCWVDGLGDREVACVLGVEVLSGGAA